MNLSLPNIYLALKILNITPSDEREMIPYLLWVLCDFSNFNETREN